MGTLILLAAITVAAAVGLAILFNKLVVKDFPETDRKAGNIKTFFVFIILFVIIFAVLYGKVIADASVKSFSAQIEQDIKKNYSNLDIVRNGIDVAAVSKDTNKLNNTVNDLTKIIKPGELGVPKFVWNIALGYMRKELQKIFNGFDAVSPFLDERNYITVSSFINGIQISVLKIIKITTIVIVSIFVVLFAIYVLVSLSKASKEKKRLENK